MMEQELFEEGWERFPGWWILIENLLFLVSWSIGFVVMYPMQIGGIPIVSLAYAVFILITVGWLLRVHNCSTCYYYDKWCRYGWGKYTAIICKEGAGNPEIGMKMAVVYMILPIIPIVGAVSVIIMHGFTIAILGWMAAFIVLNGVQFAVLRPRGCAYCKKRYICPGSGAK